MKKIIVIGYKVTRFFYRRINDFVCKAVTFTVFYVNEVEFSNFSTKGIPYISVNKNCKCIIGGNLKMNNTISSNPIGRNQRCILSVSNNGVLKIGQNVGISAVAIACMYRITIGNNVMIGGGTCIYDSDYHPLNAYQRITKQNEFIVSDEVIIEDNVFIGANSTILKGVRIGSNSVVGACSVVTKSIPENEIWGGNPAKCLKRLS